VRIDRRVAIRRSILVASVGWLWARACIAVGFVVAHAAQSGSRSATLDQGLLSWDSAFYLNLARDGYAGSPPDAVRFFPLYPTLGKAFSPIFGGREDIALVVLSNIGALVGAALLWHLASETFGGSDTATPTLADRAAIAIAIVPPAFVFAFAYTEGIALAFVAATLLALTRRSWFWVGIWAALAAASRPIGGLVLVPILVELIRVRPRPSPGRIVAAVLGPLLGFAAAMLWIYRETSDLFAPVDAQAVLRSDLRNPIVRCLEAVWALFHDNYTDIENVPFIVLWVLLVIVSIQRRQPWSWIALSVVTLVLATSAQTLDSLGRYGMLAVPLLIALAQWADRRWRQVLVAVLGSAGVTWMTAAVLLDQIVP